MLRKGGRWEELGGEETGVRPQQTLDANSIFRTEALIRWKYVYSAAQMKVFVGWARQTAFMLNRESVFCLPSWGRMYQ